LPIYPVINKATGETQELEMTISDWEKWKSENFKNGWDRDWSQGCASPGEAGFWQDKLSSNHPSWNEVLKKAGTVPGSIVKPL